MKNVKKIGLIILLILIFFSCEELPDAAGRRGIAVVPAISDINPGIFDSKDLEHTYVEFQVSVPAGTQVNNITVIGSYEDNSEGVTITESTAFPATIRITLADVAQKLGITLSTINNGDVFTFELLTLANGITSRSSAVLFVPVACAYDVSLATGSYHSVSADWNSEGNITIAADPDDPYKLYVTGLEEMEGQVEDLGPLVMYINRATYDVTVPEKAICSDGFGLGPLSYVGYGLYSSCDGSYSMYLNIIAGSYGDQGTFTFTFTRNP